MNYLNQVGVYFVNPVTNATPKEYDAAPKEWFGRRSAFPSEICRPGNE
jgi:hypothetical protein